MKMRSHCPINYLLEHIGDKWSLLIIRDLMFREKRHYNEFLESKENISTSVLGDRLKRLEESGIITKGVDQVKKSRIRYSLSEKGIDLLPILVDMIIWSGCYDAQTDADEDFLKKFNENRTTLIQSVRAKLTKTHL